MSETHAKFTYGKQLEICHNLTCTQLRDLSLKIIKIDNDWTLSDRAKLLQIGEVKEQMKSVKEVAYNRIEEYCTEYKKRLNEYIASIGGNQMDKDDIFLLQSPIVMEQEEFTALAEKHKGNYWMMRAIKDYADKINNNPQNKAQLKEAVEAGDNYTPPKGLSMPYKVYSFDDKRRRAEAAAKGHIGFIEASTYNEKSNDYESLAYVAYLTMNGYEKLDEICSE